jgi:hypothetical protein
MNFLLIVIRDKLAEDYKGMGFCNFLALDGEYTILYCDAPIAHVPASTL